MKILKTTAIFSALGFATLFASTSFAEVVYNTFTSSYQGELFPANEFGNAISLGGTARTVTQLKAWLSSQGDSTFTFRLSNLDGPGSSPGTLIWESPVQNFPYTPGVPNLPDNDIFIVPVPNIAVPNSFAWTIKTQTGPNNGWVQVGIPNVGTNLETWQYLTASSQWAPYNGTNFGAEVTAVPEPASFALVILISLIGIVRRQSRR